MINRLIFGALLVAGLALVVAPIANQAGAQQQQNQSTPVVSFEYAQLVISGEELTWDEGGNRIPQSRSLIALQRQLGSNQRASLINLLNEIGSDGWELVSNDDSQSVWNFKREKSAR